MTEYLTEEEQLQQLKDWGKKYLPVILAAVIIAVVLSAAWHAFLHHRNTVFEKASLIYDNMLQANATGNLTETTKKAVLLKNDYTDTPYAQMARLMLAKLAVSENHFIEAENQLKEVIAHQSDSPLQSIARLRLARVLLAEKKLNEAEQVLARVNDPVFAESVKVIKESIKKEFVKKT